MFEGADADKSDSMSKTETHEAFKYIIHKQIGDVHKELAGFFESATLSEASVLSQTAIDSVYTSLDTNQSGI